MSVENKKCAKNRKTICIEQFSEGGGELSGRGSSEVVVKVEHLDTEQVMKQKPAARQLFTHGNL